LTETLALVLADRGRNALDASAWSDQKAVTIDAKEGVDSGFQPSMLLFI
jgi:hypothetical protein